MRGSAGRSSLFATVLPAPGDTGVHVGYGDAANESVTCPKCGHVARQDGATGTWHCDLCNLSTDQPGSIGDSWVATADVQAAKDRADAAHELSNVAPMVLAIRYVVLAIVLPLWGTFGFYIWVPLLFRSILALSLSIAAAALTRRSSHAAEMRLHYAMSFYNEGFKRSFTAILAPTTPDKLDDDVKFLGKGADGSMVSPSFGALMTELIIATVFWVAVSSLIWVPLLVLRGK